MNRPGLGRVAFANCAPPWTSRASGPSGASAAGDLLAPVYGWFAEGFGTVDLLEANALLDTLQ
jgi:hypothetical protein